MTLIPESPIIVMYSQVPCCNERKPHSTRSEGFQQAPRIEILLYYQHSLLRMSGIPYWAQDIGGTFAAMEATVNVLLPLHMFGLLCHQDRQEVKP